MTTRAALLQSLPHPSLMKSRLRIFAMHDAILAPDMRSFEFHPKWGRGQQMGAFKNGEGNFFFAWFSPKGAVVRGFDHESAVSPFQQDPPRQWPGLFEGLPRALEYALKEPAFAQDEVTFALWATDDDAWQWGNPKLPKGKDPDGAARLLACFHKNFERWRKEYYGTARSKALEVLWWEREPLTRDVVLALNPDADLKAVRAEAKLLGWHTEGLEERATKAKPASFGEAEFTVRCEPTRVRMLSHGAEVVAEAKVDVYQELFDLVKACLLEAKRKGG